MLRRLAKRLGIAEVEGKQRLRGQITGTHWEIDAKAIDVGSGALVIVEARRHTRSRLSQEAVGAVAYRIQDLGASGAIVVSPHPLQKGAKKVAAANNVRHVRLDPDSTAEQWVATLEDLIHVEMHDRVSVSARDELELIVRDSHGNVVEHRKI